MPLKSKLFISYIVFLIIYACFTLIPKPLKATLTNFRLSATGYRWIEVSLIIILAVIWYAGFYGYYMVRKYASLVKDFKDGQHVLRIRQGLGWLVLWLPLSETVSAILKYFDNRHLNLLPAFTNINLYLNLLLPLVAFILISRGALGFSTMAKLRPKSSVVNLLLIGLIYLGLIYYHLVVSTPSRPQVYHLSLWLLLITVIAPYIYMWSVGFYASYQLYLYRRKAPGVIYRQSWRALSIGLTWLLVTTIIFQFLTTLTAHLLKFSIYGILGIVYGLLLILAIGFLLVAYGTRKLASLESV